MTPFTHKQQACRKGTAVEINSQTGAVYFFKFITTEILLISQYLSIVRILYRTYGSVTNLHSSQTKRKAFLLLIARMWRALSRYTAKSNLFKVLTAR